MNKFLLYGEASFGRSEIKAVNAVLKHGWLSGGKQTALFEKELAEWFKMRYCLATNSGSCANFIALQSLNLPKGSEVITTACAFPTTVSPIYYHGLVPVYVGIQSLSTYVIDVREIEKAITKKTKAIMFAHTLGNMCDMDYLMKLVKKHKLKLIEDVCDAVGSKWKGKLAGTFGDLATVSFYPSHHLTTAGEGGAILTNDEATYKICKSIREWGRACWCKYDEKNVNGVCGHRFDNPPFDHRYYYTNLGLNMKMTEIQAAFGREQIKRLDGFIAKRKKNFKRLYKKLEDSDWRIVLPEWGKYSIAIKLWKKPGDYSYPDEINRTVSLKPFKKANADISWFAFPITLWELDRSKFISYLENNGIQTRTLFAGNVIKHPAYKNLKHRVVGELTNTDHVLENTFFVGVGPKLTYKDMDYIADKIKKYEEV